MKNLITLQPVQSGLRAALPVFARFVFASTLLLFFWKSAMTKFDGLFTPSVGAYGQIFPKAFDAVGFDPSQMSWFYKIIAILGGYSEFILPALIVVGLFTRLSALAMFGFILVMSYVDIFGHGVAPGKFFDKDPYGIIADYRLWWTLGLLVLAAHGPGALSLDRILGIEKKEG